MASSCRGRDGRMRGSDGNTSETDLLLHPELLSKAFIKLVLHEKKIKTEVEDHDHLTDLYIQHVIPLPQRQLPNSRWGKRMEKTSPHQSPTSVHSSSTGTGRKRPLIMFDGQSTKTPSVKVKRPDLPSSTVTDLLKPQPSIINLNNPIRKLAGLSTNSSSSQSSASSIACSGRSLTGNGSLNSSSAASCTDSNSMCTKLKRAAPNPGLSPCDELKSPEMKKKIQHVTWP